MIALDTNVLVRLLVEDDDEQTARVVALLERAGRGAGSLFVPAVVLCEVVWVLDSAYGFGRGEIATALHGLLHARQLTFGDADLLERALSAYRAGRGDFADYLIREQARAAGCTRIATFDRALLREAGFERP